MAGGAEEQAPQPAAAEDDKTSVAEPGSSNSSASAGKMEEAEPQQQQQAAAARAAEEQEEGEEEEAHMDDGGDGEGEDYDSDYEYVYEDGDDAFDAEGVGGGGGVAGGGAGSVFGAANHVVFTGLDTIGNTNDMLLKKELMRVKADLEKTRRWKVDLTWTEESRSLGVLLEHEGFIKAHLNLSFPATYPSEPPKFQFLGPRFDDTVDFVLGADVFEPCRKENWNDTFTCTNLLMVVMELVKDKYPINDELAFDNFESTLIAICRSRLPGIPRKVKEGLVYFGVRLEPKEKGSKKASSGVGYSAGARAMQHDFSVHDARFKEHLESFKKLMALARDATAVTLARVAHIHLAAWLLQYLEDELPIFKYEEAAGLIAEAIALLHRVDPEAEELPRIEAVHGERELLLRPDLKGAGRRRRTASSASGAGAGAAAAAAAQEEGEDEEEDEEEERVFSVEEVFAHHQYKAEAANATPSMEVIKRIMLEVTNLKDHLRGMTDGQIFVCFSEAQCLLWKVLIIPSSGTPYYGGCFEFHLAIPPDYPNHPPKCLFMTTGGAQVRFNPNLYHNGKVCLSLLGTWSGEPWDPQHSNLSQLLISILAFIFTTEPLRNEPGLETSGEKAIQFYNSYIRAETVAHAMIHQLTSPPPEFADVIKAHFRKAWHTLIRRDLLAWGERNDLVAPEGAATDPGWGASQSQIHRMAWFRAAQGPGNYKKLILQEVAKMDELVAALGGAVMVMPDAGAEGGGGVAADLREEAAGAAGGGGGKSDGRAAAASSAASAAAMATAVAGSGKAGSSGSGSCVQGVRF